MNSKNLWPIYSGLAINPALMTVLKTSSGVMFSDSTVRIRSSLSKSTNAIKVAENVAKGYTTAKDVVEGWVLSEGHYINLVGSYSHTAVSVAQNSEGVLYYTQIFYQGSD